jgi:hypothetical protein
MSQTISLSIKLWYVIHIPLIYSTDNRLTSSLYSVCFIFITLTVFALFNPFAS